MYGWLCSLRALICVELLLRRLIRLLGLRTKEVTAGTAVRPLRCILECKKISAILANEKMVFASNARHSSLGRARANELTITTMPHAN